MWVGMGDRVRVGVNGWGRRWAVVVVVSQAFLEGTQPVSECPALFYSDSWVNEGITKQLAGILQGS